MTRPADLPEHERDHLQDLLTACPHLTVLAERIRAFAELLINRHGAELENCPARRPNAPLSGRARAWVPRPGLRSASS